MITIHKIGLVCLIETRVKESNADMIRDLIAQNWDFFFSTMRSISWVGFGFIGKKSNFEVTVLDKCDQSISFVIHYSKENLSWFHYFVYGAKQMCRKNEAMAELGCYEAKSSKQSLDALW
jgi:hypothetical protein